ncbi:hypothetical protein CDL12_04780 [Handroanthus impetiginosus]|uniref:Uncharacterized protein n=1 Tax=Handroanthus impetiginosus TaxID=429701 RepID=A0A2G9HYB6_9LAMI|nr:hypothetical protein CDL12_04780 [Handroanthus impetiginosus]
MLSVPGVCLKIVRPAPTPEYVLQQESHNGRLEISRKMPARHPADKVHYIVQGLATYPFSDFGTGHSQNGFNSYWMHANGTHTTYILDHQLSSM